MVWMLPLAMEAALDDPGVALAKFLSVPLLIGVPIALSWPLADFVVRAVVPVELIAIAFRLGSDVGAYRHRACGRDTRLHTFRFLITT